MPSKAELKYDEDFKKETMRLWRMLRRLSDQLEEGDATEMRITEIRIQGPNRTGDGFRAIVKGLDDFNSPFVAFHNATNLGELMGGLAERADNGTLKWREDLPYTGKGARATPPQEG